MKVRELTEEGFMRKSGSKLSEKYNSMMSLLKRGKKIKNQPKTVLKQNESSIGNN